VARELKVGRMSTSRWYRQWKKSGAEALKAAARAGRKPLPRRVELPTAGAAEDQRRKGTEFSRPQLLAMALEATRVICAA
jgi:hypothetical protein